jgi:hypothetical protein
VILENEEGRVIIESKGKKIIFRGRRVLLSKRGFKKFQRAICHHRVNAEFGILIDPPGTNLPSVIAKI